MMAASARKHPIKTKVERMAPAALNIGSQPYPGYRLCRPIGRGGFSEVWQAEGPDGLVALKFLPCNARQTAAREVRSLQAISQLEHPHLLRIQRIWGYEGFVVLAMDLADGSLADLMQVYQTQFGTPIVAEHVCLLLSEAAEALDFLNVRQHQVNGQRVAIQHCDIKPSNLLLFGQTLKVADFGLSSPLCSRLDMRSRAGTLDFCAPEVFQGRLSTRTDQYALAVTYCLARGGRLPFQDTPAYFQSRYVRPAPDLSMLSAPERPIVSRALNAVPQNRWGSCVEFLRRLTRVVCQLDEQPVV
jgi:serine/threonine protein kinase